MQELTNTKSDVAMLTQTSKGEPGMGKTNRPETVDNSTQLQTINKDNLPGSPHFIKLEKNLISFGFFTASSKRIKTEKAKTILITRKIKGKEIKAEATIVPSALYGLPVTADQDKFIAFMNILQDIKEHYGKVTNPVAFTSAELMALLEISDGGKNYDEVSEWLDIMTNTGIISQGTVYLAKGKKWARDRFHVFERAYSKGQEMPNGTVADKNYVWLSEWQLENVNNGFLIPIELRTYRTIKKNISKALVPLLQIWLFASRRAGLFEKDYEEFCDILGIQKYKYISVIKQVLKPVFDELQEKEYIAKWDIQERSDGKYFKVMLWHGDKFKKDRKERLAQKKKREQQKLLDAAASQPQPEKTEEHETPPAVIEATARIVDLDPNPAAEQAADLDGIDLALLEELVKRGINNGDGPTDARALIKNSKPGQVIMDNVEWCDYLLSKKRPEDLTNAAGLYVRFVQNNVVHPPNVKFESTREYHNRVQKQVEQKRQEDEQERFEQAYAKYRGETITAYIKENYSSEQYQGYLKGKELEEKVAHPKVFKFFTPALIANYIESKVRADLAKQITFIPFEEFCRTLKEKEAQDHQAALAQMRPASPSPTTPEPEQGIGEHQLSPAASVTSSQPEAFADPMALDPSGQVPTPESGDRNETT